MTHKTHLKISRKGAMVYVELTTEDLLFLAKTKACTALHVADPTNAFLVKGGVVQDEKARVCDLGFTAGEKLDLMLRTEIAIKTD
jgi:hypothetical protein